MFEFNLRIECPHCGEEETDVAAFDMCEADQGGANSILHQTNCQYCDKDFWYKAYLSFDVEPSFVWKKKPKEEVLE